ncbi:MAG: Na+/H+ antiporter NhaA [Coriobacteriia bacterium]|jgi:NhaA family Na+:H+ antiporter
MLKTVKGAGRRARVFHAAVREGFAEFLHLEVAGSIVLLLATLIALVTANTGLSHWWAEVWHVEIGLSFGGAEFSQSALHWIDDGLMALFFFVIGLEIKREILVGELSTLRKATLPIMAAVGGMLAPALIYAAFNHGGEAAQGWGIPMATDLAFALGVLALLGSRVPSGLKVFMAALAIADDIGAVLVIALFYTSEIFTGWLLLGAGLLLVLVFFNVLKIESPIPYAFVGTAVWFCFFNSGVHATIAGVLIALTIPSRSRMDPMEFVRWARGKIDEIEALEVPGAHVLDSPDQQVCAQELSAEARWVQAPLQRMEHSILPISTFIILPLFALANAGVRFQGYDIWELLFEPVTLGVLLGLVIGKPLGITAFTWIAVKTKLADLPAGVSWRHVVGAGLLGGIGFTMALFVSGLALRVGILQAEAKLAVLMTSVLAGVIGYVVLRGAEPGEVDANGETV